MLYFLFVYSLLYFLFLSLDDKYCFHANIEPLKEFPYKFFWQSTLKQLNWVILLETLKGFFLRNILRLNKNVINFQKNQ